MTNFQDWLLMTGSRVRVTLTDDGTEVREGILVRLDMYGEAAIEADDGKTYYCWPVLNCEKVEAREDGEW
jgi:hypothetical protein